MPTNDITVSMLNYFTCDYILFLFVNIIIAILIKQYDFLLGVFIFTMPVFITNLLWINKKCRVKGLSEPIILIIDILTHFFPFFVFMYILFFTKIKIQNKNIFWFGYGTVILLSCVYLFFNNIKDIYKHSHPILTMSIFVISLIICTICIYKKLL